MLYYLRYEIKDTFNGYMFIADTQRVAIKTANRLWNGLIAPARKDAIIFQIEDSNGAVLLDLTKPVEK